MKLRTLAKILGGIVALLIVAALALPMFVSSETLKAQLVAKVKETTGRTLEIKGATSVSFFPNIAVTAQEVTLYNPDGFASPFLVKMKKLETGAALGPLLSGNLRVTGITLEGAEVYLEESKGGAKNWEFTAEKVKEEAEKETKKPEAQQASFIKSFALGDIEISDSALHYRKPGAEPVAIEEINITLSGADANAPLKLEGSATYHQKTIQANLVVEELKAFLADKDSPVKATIAVPGATVDFNGNARMKETLTASGDFKADISSLPSVMEWATGKEPAGSLPKMVLIEGRLSASNNRYGIEGGTFKVNDTEATGKLSVDAGGAVPKIVGALTFGELDLNDWKSAKGTDSGASGGGNGKAEGWSSEPIDFSALKAVNSSLALKFAAIKSDKLVLGPTELDVKIDDGALRLSIDEAALYSGTAKGVIIASPGGIGADIALQKVKIEPLMEALSGKSRLEGTADMKLAVKGAGNSERAIVSSLNGTGNIMVRDGAIKGINLAKFWREAKKGFLFESSAESTDFSELSGSFTIANGIASNNDLAMKSPNLRLKGEGTVNLPSRTVNYKLNPTIVATSKGQGGKDDLGGIEVPLIITGPWSNPSITPDLAGMLKDPAALEQNLKNIKESVKDFNSVDDIKRALTGEPAPAAPAETAPATTEPAPAVAPTPAPEPTPEDKLKNLLKSF